MAFGNIVWIGLRLTLVATALAIVIVAFGASRSALLVLAIPVGVLTGLVFATPIMAFTATQRTPDRFAALFRSTRHAPVPVQRDVLSGSRACPRSSSRSPGSRRCGMARDACRMLMLGTVDRDPVLFVIHLGVLGGHGHRRRARGTDDRSLAGEGLGADDDGSIHARPVPMTALPR